MTTTYRPVRDAIALAAFVAIVGALAVILAAGRAHAATVTHTSGPTPAQSACTAFARWQHHETTANLGRLVIASARLPKSYLKADVFQLAADASSPSPKAAKYVTGDARYVGQDCHS